MSCAKITEPIEMQFWNAATGGSSEHVLHENADAPTGRSTLCLYVGQRASAVLLLLQNNVTQSIHTNSRNDSQSSDYMTSSTASHSREQNNQNCFQAVSCNNHAHRMRVTQTHALKHHFHHVEPLQDILHRSAQCSDMKQFHI